MYDNRKYVELNENGILKRIHDLQAELSLSRSAIQRSYKELRRDEGTP